MRAFLLFVLIGLVGFSGCVQDDAAPPAAAGAKEHPFFATAATPATVDITVPDDGVYRFHLMFREETPAYRFTVQDCVRDGTGSYISAGTGTATTTVTCSLQEGRSTVTIESVGVAWGAFSFTQR